MGTSQAATASQVGIKGAAQLAPGESVKAKQSASCELVTLKSDGVGSEDSEYQTAGETGVVATAIAAETAGDKPTAS